VIVSRIAGGLGNQMFQYAAGRRVADRLGVEFQYDLTGFDTYKLHACALHRFSLQSRPMDRALVPRLPARFGGSRWRRLLRIGGPPLSLFREDGLAWQSSIESVGDNSYLVGYWQSEKYFADIRPKLVQEFTLSSPAVGRDLQVMKEMAAATSVMLHVRRGDYVSNAGTNQIHGTCDESYYQRAVALLADKCGPLHLFVFSDDPAWCRENLKFKHPTTVVDHNDASRNCEDLRLMSQAQHFIIANSSFSWWGAWLSMSPGKIICAPQLWFRTTDRDESDIVPAAWRRI
jgi:hypothetical protein